MVLHEVSPHSKTDKHLPLHPPSEGTTRVPADDDIDLMTTGDANSGEDSDKVTETGSRLSSRTNLQRGPGKQKRCMERQHQRLIAKYGKDNVIPAAEYRQRRAQESGADSTEAHTAIVKTAEAEHVSLEDRVDISFVCLYIGVSTLIFTRASLCHCHTK